MEHLFRFYGFAGREIDALFTRSEQWLTNVPLR
jgi:hypothetical protein